MKTPIVLQVEIEGRLIKLQFDQLDSPTPQQLPFVKLPAFDEERRMINKLLIERYKAMGYDDHEIPSEPFPNGYALSDLKIDLAVISETSVQNWEDREKLVLSLLETNVIWHIKKHGRLSRRDVEGYTTVCVLVACALMAVGDAKIGTRAYSMADSGCTAGEKQQLYNQASLVIREKYFEHYVHANLIDALNNPM